MRETTASTSNLIYWALDDVSRWNNGPTGRKRHRASEGSPGTVENCRLDAHPVTLLASRREPTDRPIDSCKRVPHLCSCEREGSWMGPIHPPTSKGLLRGVLCLRGAASLSWIIRTPRSSGLYEVRSSPGSTDRGLEGRSAMGSGIIIISSSSTRSSNSDQALWTWKSLGHELLSASEITLRRRKRRLGVRPAPSLFSTRKRSNQKEQDAGGSYCTLWPHKAIWGASSSLPTPFRGPCANEPLTTVFSRSTTSLAATTRHSTSSTRAGQDVSRDDRVFKSSR
jgi:hypothetical protein